MTREELKAWAEEDRVRREGYIARAKEALLKEVRGWNGTKRRPA